MRFFLYSLMFLAFSANAEMTDLIIKDGDVSTKEIMVKAGEKVEFKIQNLDRHFEEVKSKELHFKIEVPLNSEVIVSMPALKAGIYPFKVDFVEPGSKQRNHKVIDCKIIVK